MAAELGKNQFMTHRALVADKRATCACERLRVEVSDSKEVLRRPELEDEIIQPSKSKELARELVEPNFRLVDGRYEIPVPLKSDIVNNLTNNFHSAVDRTAPLCKKALKYAGLKRILADTFHELIDKSWLVPVVDSDFDHDKCRNLPFFVSKQDKPRVVFDGAATFQGLPLKNAVFPGVNLLNGLVGVLKRFRLGRFACMADLSKCFFQVALPREQQDWFRLVRFKDNEIDIGKTQVYRFTRHVWDINSSPYIALFAIERLIDENPTCASQLTLTSIVSKRYINDLFLSFDSFHGLRLVKQDLKALVETRGLTFIKPMLNADMLEDALTDIITYVQSRCFGAAVRILKRDSADGFDAILKRINQNANNAADMKRVSELKTLQNVRPCVGTDSIFRVEGRLENAEFPLDCKHPIILPGSHALTHQIVLHEHVLTGHAGPSCTLVKVRQRFWIIYGVSNVKRFLSECSRCARRNVVPACRVTASNNLLSLVGWIIGAPSCLGKTELQSCLDCKA